MTKKTKDTQGYKDFLVNGIRVHGVFKRPLAYYCFDNDVSQKEVVFKAVSNFLNDHMLKNEQFKNDLEEIDKLLQDYHNTNDQGIKINKGTNMIFEYIKSCYNNGKYKDLKEIIDLIERLKKRQVNQFIADSRSEDLI